MLYNGEYLPATRGICFIEHEFSDIIQTFVPWQKKIAFEPEFTIELECIKATACEMIRDLFPLSNDYRRHLFLPTRSGYTAYLNNSLHGTDVAPFLYLQRKIECRGFRVVSSPHTYRKKEEKGYYGSAILELHCPDKNEERTIYCIHDGYRWEFNEYGKPFPFEDLSLYKKRLKRERFNPEILKSYTDELGIFFQDEDFYCPPGSPDPVMICKRGPRWPNYRDKTLEEYQNER